MRDYIHVADLAQAHLLALDALATGEHRIYNLGNGTGFSNRRSSRRSARSPGTRSRSRSRRAAPATRPSLVASSEKARRELGWVPARPDLHDIVADAWEFYRHG